MVCAGCGVAGECASYAAKLPEGSFGTYAGQWVVVEREVVEVGTREDLLAWITEQSDEDGHWEGNWRAVAEHTGLGKDTARNWLKALVSRSELRLVQKVSGREAASGRMSVWEVL